VVISWIPLLPEWLRTDPTIEKWFFIDQTLSQLFFYYRLAGSVSRRTVETALARERLNYKSAKGIITESKWAANSVANEYGVPDDKIHVVLPGASLDHLAYERWAASGQVIGGRKPSGALSLVFVGKYWGRKGLDRLLDAFAIARSRGAAVSLKIIGFPLEQAPSKYRMLPGVRWLGGIDKRTAAERFMNELSECDVGCLLSRQEAGGIALREYHALGLAALAPETGGSPEYVLAEAAILVPPDMDAAGIASIISELAQNPEKVAAMKRMAWARRREFTWDQTMPTIGRILNAGAERANA
jgi:glycosyltransferase involved in cell wall biosynthesis